jgi:hypothetical protein
MIFAESEGGFPNRKVSDSTCWLGGGRHGWQNHILQTCVSESLRRSKRPACQGVQAMAADFVSAPPRPLSLAKPARSAILETPIESTSPEAKMLHY